MNKKSMPYCTSYKCTGITHSINGPRLVLKAVLQSAINCPDCGSVLYWKTSRVGHTASKFNRKLTDKERDWLI